MPSSGNRVTAFKATSKDVREIRRARSNNEVVNCGIVGILSRGNEISATRYARSTLRFIELNGNSRFNVPRHRTQNWIELIARFGNEIERSKVLRIVCDDESFLMTVILNDDKFVERETRGILHVVDRAIENVSLSTCTELRYLVNYDKNNSVIIFISLHDCNSWYGFLIRLNYNVTRNSNFSFD